MTLAVVPQLVEHFSWWFTMAVVAVVAVVAIGPAAGAASMVAAGRGRSATPKNPIAAASEKNVSAD